MITATTALKTGTAIAKTGVTAAKSGLSIATKLAVGAHAVCENKFGDLAERCLPEGTDFQQLNSLPLHLEQKVRVCREIAEKTGLDGLKTTLDDIINQYASPLFQVMFVGRYSTGKSSVINALLGQDILPSGTIPTTKVLTWLLNGEEDAVLCETDDNKLVPSSIDKLKDPSDENQLNHCNNIFIMTQNPMLEAGVAIIDTPGLSDVNKSTVELTESAIESADAVIYVMDTYVSSSDKDFLSGLVKKGKTHNLFVVVNKIDSVPKEEREEFLAERIKLLGDLSIAANIYPLSAIKTEFKPLLDKFREALVCYLANGMKEARNASIEGRLNSALDMEHDVCVKSQELQKQNEQEKEKARHKMNEDAQKIHDAIHSISSKADSEVSRVEETVLFNWQRKLRAMQEEINVKIDSARAEDLQRRDFIENTVIGETYKFLSDEMDAAAKSLEQWTRNEWESNISPNLGFELGSAKRSPLANVPSALWSAGLFIIAASPITGTFMAIKMIALATIGGPMIDGVCSSLSNLGELAIMRKQLREALDEQWDKLDSGIRLKIHEMFRSMKTQIHESIDKNSGVAMGPNKALLDILDNKNCDVKASPEQLSSWLTSIQNVR